MVRGHVVPIRAQDRRQATPMKFNVDYSLHNRFDVEVSRGGEIIQRAVGHNIILNALWTWAISTSKGHQGWFRNIAFGSGTGTLDYSRTSLFTPIGQKPCQAGYIYNNSSWNGGKGSCWFRRSIVLQAGEYTGQTLREVGILRSTDQNALMTHALLKDMNGNTVAIEIQPLDVVTIYATIFLVGNPAGYLGDAVLFADVVGSDTGLIENLVGLGSIGANIFSGQYLSFLTEARVPPSSLSKSIADSGAVDVENRQFIFRASLAAGPSYRVGYSELNPSGGGGWRAVGVYTAPSNPKYQILVNIPNSVRPYSTIYDEAVGTGDGSTVDFPLDFGYILNDGSFTLKVDGNPVSSADYSVDWDLPANASNYYYLISRHSGDATVWGTTRLSGSNLYEIVENPLYARGVGISSLNVYRCRIEVSEDLEVWTQIYTTTGTNQTFNVPSEYQASRYWKATKTSASIGGINSSGFISNITFPHIHFNTAPADGSIITATYRTATVCKDATHVVDVEISISLGEYVPV